MNRLAFSMTDHSVHKKKRLDRNCALISAMSLAAMGHPAQLAALLPKRTEPRKWANKEADEARRIQRAMRRQY